jgi:DNA-directed RNA polymerase subunit RPC12/RpoP
MNKSQIGFACGKTCAECGDAVSLDAQGRYTCFACGRFVSKVKDAQNYEQIRLPAPQRVPKLQNMPN